MTGFQTGSENSAEHGFEVTAFLHMRHIGVIGTGTGSGMASPVILGAITDSLRSL